MTEGTSSGLSGSEDMPSGERGKVEPLVERIARETLLLEVSPDGPITPGEVVGLVAEWLHEWHTAGGEPDSDVVGVLYGQAAQR